MTHIYVKMVALHERLHTQKYPRLQYFLLTVQFEIAMNQGWKKAKNFKFHLGPWYWRIEGHQYLFSARFSFFF